jgi:hypothetical protein
MWSDDGTVQPFGPLSGVPTVEQCLLHARTNHRHYTKSEYCLILNIKSMVQIYLEFKSTTKILYGIKNYVQYFFFPRIGGDTGCNLAQITVLP